MPLSQSPLLKLLVIERDSAIRSAIEDEFGRLETPRFHIKSFADGETADRFLHSAESASVDLAVIETDLSDLRGRNRVLEILRSSPQCYAIVTHPRALAPETFPDTRRIMLLERPFEVVELLAIAAGVICGDRDELRERMAAMLQKRLTALRAQRKRIVRAIEAVDDLQRVSEVSTPVDFEPEQRGDREPAGAIPSVRSQDHS